MNCWNGFFQHPSSMSLGEQLVLESGEGAIAYWGPTGVSTSTGQQPLAVRFYEELFDSPTFGAAILTTKRTVDLGGDATRRVYLDTWTLLGDPELRVR